MGQRQYSNVNTSVTSTQSNLEGPGFNSVSEGNKDPRSDGENITYTNQTLPIKMSSTGNFSFSLTDLDPGTTHYFRSKAFRQGTSYSQEMSFKTKNLERAEAAQSPAIRLTSSSNPSFYGQQITFTSTVSAVPPATGIPTGSVTFNDGLSELGTSILDNSDQATWNTSMLSPGTHIITAVYNGDTNFLLLANIYASWSIKT